VKYVPKNKTQKELAEEVCLLDTMLSALVDLLEKKGLLTQAEWEKQIKQRITIK
jgi:DNA-binding MarR family transcriptional regulator